MCFLFVLFLMLFVLFNFNVHAKFLFQVSEYMLKVFSCFSHGCSTSRTEFFSLFLCFFISSLYSFVTSNLKCSSPILLKLIPFNPEFEKLELETTGEGRGGSCSSNSSWSSGMAISSRTKVARSRQALSPLPLTFTGQPGCKQWQIYSAFHHTEATSELCLPPVSYKRLSAILDLGHQRNQTD